MEGSKGETYAYTRSLMESIGLGAPLLLVLAVVALIPAPVLALWTPRSPSVERVTPTPTPGRWEPSLKQ